VGGWGLGFAWIPFILIPLFWIGLIVLFVSLARRRGRGAWGPGAWGPGHGNGWGGRPGGAESTLAERFANGDIDEKEYRARLEVLRASNPFAPKP
jgi:putative membrane protein